MKSLKLRPFVSAAAIALGLTISSMALPVAPVQADAPDVVTTSDEDLDNDFDWGWLGLLGLLGLAGLAGRGGRRDYDTSTTTTYRDPATTYHDPDRT